MNAEQPYIVDEPFLAPTAADAGEIAPAWWGRFPPYIWIAGAILLAALIGGRR